MTPPLDSADLARGWIEAWIVHTSPFGRLAGRDHYLATVEPMARRSVQRLVIVRVLGEGDEAAIWFENHTPAGVVPSCDWVRAADGRIREIQSFYDSAAVRNVLSPDEQDTLGDPA